MGRYAQVVIGPAGCGKSTYCQALQAHCQAAGRACHVVNMDPAADNFGYEAALDLRALVTVDDVMEAMELGPNGALMCAMEFLEEHIPDWLAPELEGFAEDDYVVFDCPGQIELYSHAPSFKAFIDHLRRTEWNVCAVFMIDSHFMTDAAKFIAGSMTALSAMVQLELPHVNVLTKLDMLENKEDVEAYLDVDAKLLTHSLNRGMPRMYHRLNESVAQIVDEFSMVSYFPLDYSNEDSLQDLVLTIDNAIQYGEDMDVKDTLKAYDDDEGGVPGMAGLAL